MLKISKANTNEEAEEDSGHDSMMYEEVWAMIVCFLSDVFNLIKLFLIYKLLLLLVIISISISLFIFDHTFLFWLFIFLLAFSQ